MGVSASVRWLSRRVSTVSSRCIRSWSVPNAAVEPTSPLRTASHTMLGSVSTRRQKSGSPGAGPQLITVSRPASAAVLNMATTPPSIWLARKRSVRTPPTRKAPAWKTLVQTTALTPPSPM